MFIKNNHISGQLYVPYTGAIRKLSKSARQLATGEKIPTAQDGGGELGVADHYKLTRTITSTLLDEFQAFSAYLDTQDEVLSQATDIINRMAELASNALDTTKDTADRAALNSEFQALNTEFAQLAGHAFNGMSLFGNAQTIRTGIETGDTLAISAINLGTITFTAFSLGTTTDANSALLDLVSSLQSLNIMKGFAGNNSNEIERIVDFTRAHISGLSDGESAIRNIDFAIATGEFTKDQVLLATSQSALSQSNGLIQSALAFLA